MSRDVNSDLAERVLQIKQEVMSYLAQHPEAKDTAAGIMLWWLPAGIRRSSDLMQALEELLQAGGITSSSFGGTTVYGLDRARADVTERER